ncbi:MAG: YfhO family protein [Bacteroidales bacterium]|nr:YfhO family protein [Bacteroidales bacterium]
MSTFRDKYLSYVVAGIFILVLLLIMFYPALEGKTILQEDVMSWKANSKEAFDYYHKTGKQAFWANNVFSGMPTYQITIKHWGNLFLHVDKALTLFLPFFMGIIFLIFTGFYLFTRWLKMNHSAALLGALAFTLSSYFFIILAVGHNSKAHAIAYMVPYLISVFFLYRGKYLLGTLLTAAILALELSCNHVQVTYYLAFMVLFLVISEFIHAIKEKAFKRFFVAAGLHLASVLIAILVNFSNIYTSYQYAKETIRGKSELTSKENVKGLDKSYITQWSYSPGETWTLIIPNAKGGASQPIKIDGKRFLSSVENPQVRGFLGEWHQYWGEQPFTSGPVYAGIVISFLFLLSLFLSSHPLKWPLLAISLLALVLSWGHHASWLTNFFIDYIPLYDKFRAPSMWLIVLEITIPLLAVFFIHDLLTRKEELQKKIKVLYITGGIMTFILLLFYLSPSSFFSFISSNDTSMIEQYKNYFSQQSSDPAQNAQINAFFENFEQELIGLRIQIFKQDVLRSLIFLLLTFTLLWAYFKWKFKPIVLVSGLALFIAADMIPVNKRYLNNKNFVSKAKAEKPFTASFADMHILQNNPEGHRTLNLSVNTFNDATTSYFHRSIGGYHAAKLMRYQELIENQISPQIKLLTSYLQNNITPEKLDTVLSRMNILNMLNTRYIIVNPNAQPIINPHHCGFAWFVDRAIIVENADEEIQRVGEIDPKREVTVDKRFAHLFKSIDFTHRDTSATIQRTNITPNEVSFTVQTTTPQLAVISEIWYPEWEVYIDGKKVDLLRVNYVLRGVVVPAGAKEITMKIYPHAFIMSSWISLASSIILLGAISTALFFYFRKNTSFRKNENESHS